MNKSTADKQTDSGKAPGVMTWDKWQSLTENERQQIRSDKDLTPQLKGLEGYRVEVITEYNEKRRFIVGKSTGWSPIHLEICNRRSSGGTWLSIERFDDNEDRIDDHVLRGDED